MDNFRYHNSQLVANTIYM